MEPNRLLAWGVGLMVALAATAGAAEPFTYANPIHFQQGIGTDEVRDPCILREGGTYYLVFTCYPFRNREERRLADVDAGSSPGIRLYASKDLQNWTFVKYLVKSSELSQDCPYKHRFWAPEIHKIGGRFYLIFTADNWLKKEYNPAGTWGTAGYAFVGVADRVDGPFEHITYLKGGACDTSLFEDADGKTYAVIPRGNVDVQQVDLSHLSDGKVELLGKPKRIVTADNADIGMTDHPKYLEGPFVIRRGGKYVLFYAGPSKDAAGKDAGYWTGAAYADNVWGPWTKDPRGKVFLGGHLAVFDGPDGRNWFSYRGESRGLRGLLCVDPFDVDANGRVNAGEPTVGPRTIAAAPALAAPAAPVPPDAATPKATAWHPAPGPLMTKWAADVSPDHALPEYPRPQMARERWQSLNGLWEYAITPKAAESRPSTYDGQILVPFCVESALSGVMKPLRPDQRLVYRRTFDLPADWPRNTSGGTGGDRVLLHFGAVDYEATVWVNGRNVGSHRGGFDAFQLDITGALKQSGPQEVVVSVWDPTDAGWQLRGKQTLRPGGAAYTACSGIWQTVWLEPVPAAHTESVRTAGDPATGVARVTVAGRVPVRATALEVTALDGGRPVATATATLGGELTPDILKNLAWYKATSVWASTDASLTIANPKPWTPDAPFLYDLRVDLKDADGKVLDRVTSYFGLRTIAVGHDDKGNTRPMLNGRPIMLAGALDQGFWPDGVYTAPTDEALRFDVEAAKRLGLAAVRKHIKVEPQRWYYWADRLGLLVLQDMPSGKQGDPFSDRPTSPEAATACDAEMAVLIDQLAAHPSIICWNLYNEGWGQFDTLRHAAWAKALDPTRLVNEASGFPRHGGGDVVDTHGGIAPRDPRRISLDSETAGYGLTVPDHRWPGKPWATGTYDPATGREGPAKELYPLDDDARRWYTRGVRDFYRALWVNKDATGSSGDFKVQLTDVETESNGLLTYDRAVWKVDPDVIRPVARGEDLSKDAPEPTKTTAWPDPKLLDDLAKKRASYRYRESDVPKYTLPDPLLCTDGTKVTTREEWESKRRPETLELFRTHVYGHSPAPGDISFELLETDPNAADGKATRKRIRITSRQQGKSFSFEASLLIPNGATKKSPAFILINNRPLASADPTRAQKNGFWPAEEILARGYATAVFRTGDVDPDKDGPDARAAGVRAAFTAGKPGEDAWATIAAWAWGASRVLDYLQTDPAIDAAHVAVVGHSRGGKTALWAAAQDTRFAMACSNCSGRGGASLARRRMGETVKAINKGFPYWFCDNYHKYDDREDDLPVDAHQLIALIAPRPVYVVSAEADFWADQRGEFLSLVNAAPVFALYGQSAFQANEMPNVEQPLIRDHMAYHMHPGIHNLTPYDWERYMDFADKVWK